MTLSRIILVALLFSAVLTDSSRADTPARAPNTLVIYSDDHGWADLGLQGVDSEIPTPHLDQLTRDGVRFTRGYVAAPQCV
ncbi:MAG: sulfatase-like hydrolase/transferase, partial [Pirellula sp.]